MRRWVREMALELMRICAGSARPISTAPCPGSAMKVFPATSIASAGRSTPPAAPGTAALSHRLLSAFHPLCYTVRASTMSGAATFKSSQSISAAKPTKTRRMDAGTH